MRYSKYTLLIVWINKSLLTHMLPIVYITGVSVCLFWPVGSCQHHPGGPIFHDALKGWSCCKKRSTDFTEFLNIPGCSFGRHSNIKPLETEKQAKIDCEDAVVSGENGILGDSFS